ncbi:MAG: FAD-binding oxidoreductase [Deltaproteobacteria bacterium]|nr:FAD-binding oxidoreductase [Deltaproteobacteria bacterium]MBW2016674.1 FAD-binding oxidoreductase [Deltaproteobacteria bacterium]MBW2129161.1 FAD-binding oxidoreductase [Deltaproteobacteria bacterium]MBW2304188.1 FAD-binding oxidoreductase [Deltaproteobacteria bacterium]
MEDIKRRLCDIVGERFVSDRAEELFFYGRDPGLMPPHSPDFVALPGTVEEVREIVKLAFREGVPVVPMGAGMTLTGLCIPRKGGIVLDMKRMNRILEVNDRARYTIVEGGTPTGALKAYLDAHHPRLRFSIPDSPAATTIAANVMIHGQGRLTQQYGFNSDMVTGLEVVLPTGDVARIGSCSLSPDWFSKGAPLPDLSGLFLGWLGTTGVITKVGLKLYPRKKMREVEIFITDSPDFIPDIIYEITHTEMTEDINIFAQPLPLIFKDNHHVVVYFTGDTDEELEFKKKSVFHALDRFIKNKDGGFMTVGPGMKQSLLDMPQRSASTFADVTKGGGFEYSGPIILVEKYPQCSRKLDELAEKYDLKYHATARIIGRGHAMMFAFSFTFNRADEDMMDRVRAALREASEFALSAGGVFWKPTVDEQRRLLQAMDPVTRRLMQMIKRNLDPSGIMNPGNWEVP